MKIIYSENYQELLPTIILSIGLGIVFLSACIYFLIVQPVKGLCVEGHTISYKHWGILIKLINQILPGVLFFMLTLAFLVSGITMLFYSYDMAYDKYSTAEGIIVVESYEEIMNKGDIDYKFRCKIKIGDDIVLHPSNEFERDIFDSLCLNQYGRISYYRFWTGSVSVIKIEFQE